MWRPPAQLVTTSFNYALAAHFLQLLQVSLDTKGKALFRIYGILGNGVKGPSQKRATPPSCSVPLPVRQSLWTKTGRRRPSEQHSLLLPVGATGHKKIYLKNCKNGGILKEPICLRQKMGNLAKLQDTDIVRIADLMSSR